MKELDMREMAMVSGGLNWETILKGAAAGAIAGAATGSFGGPIGTGAGAIVGAAGGGLAAYIADEIKF